jgi:hypothetical protein
VEELRTESKNSAANGARVGDPQQLCKSAVSGYSAASVKILVAAGHRLALRPTIVFTNQMNSTNDAGFDSFALLCAVAALR